MPAPSLANLPLFPLHTVLFPEGLLGLKVFEARYVDLVSACLRTAAPFGVVRLLEGREVHSPGEQPVRFETIGVLAHVREVDSDQPGILAVRCEGAQRFTLAAPRQRNDGLWLAEATLVRADETVAVPPEHQRSAQALKSAIGSLAGRGRKPFSTPYRFDDAGWVANRWCELLPVPVAAKQRLMALDDPLLRLRLVDEYLRSHGVA